VSPISIASVKLAVSRIPRHVAPKTTPEISPSAYPSSAVVYRVIRSFAATSGKDGHFLTVRKGALLTVEGPLKRFGLMEAICAEQTLLVFTRDIEMCAECIAPPPRP
jgi:hypothetical protein